MKEKDFLKSLIKQIEPYFEQKKKCEIELIYHFNYDYRKTVSEELNNSKAELIGKLKEQVEFLSLDKEQPSKEKKNLNYVLTLIDGVIYYGLTIEELFDLLKRLELII